MYLTRISVCQLIHFIIDAVSLTPTVSSTWWLIHYPNYFLFFINTWSKLFLFFLIKQYHLCFAFEWPIYIVSFLFVFSFMKPTHLNFTFWNIITLVFFKWLIKRCKLFKAISSNYLKICLYYYHTKLKQHHVRGFI